MYYGDSEEDTWHDQQHKEFMSSLGGDGYAMVMSDEWETALPPDQCICGFKFSSMSVENVSDDDFESYAERSDDEEDDFDWELYERKQILDEVMERHPDMVFTGSSVYDYLHNGGELESIDDQMRGEM